MRAEPPSHSRRGQTPAYARDFSTGGPNRRCPYLEQILRESAGPFGMLTRFKADCHVDHRTHNFTGRHPSPPCITQPETCSLYHREHRTEDARIERYRD
jgi:hypothetical protein